MRYVTIPDPPCPFAIGDWVECMGGIRIKGRIETLEWAEQTMTLEGHLGQFNPRAFQKMDDPPAATSKKASPDPVYSPPHYTSHPTGIEAIEVIEWMSFNVGAAIKYLWRQGLKGDAIEDLKKARWFIDREIARLERMKK